ncbi:hypothetical protein HYALB_00011529 [Hymenoscyphus albidus]|uniref:Rhodanese domain-containing protein n=1 Tax=Hymenoscyphus albidus TaxID=595503 RepID=A0A9N9LV27_9HELO|nr:hypothetical protein HYALB_00011529 [Hymenoscyphus albidus]
MTSPAPDWTTAFPPPRATVLSLTGGEVVKMFDDMDITSSMRGFLLVDVRREDWVGGTIKTSLNLPAQSFYQSRKVLLDLCERAGIKMVVFYCGSSNGRGPRCANWMQDSIDDIAKFGMKSTLQVRILKGGIKGWVREFQGGFMEGFEEGMWDLGC